MVTAGDLVATLESELEIAESVDPDVPLSAYNEHHLHYVLGRHLEELGASRVVLEARHGSYGNDFCDIYAEWQRCELWLEVKRGWHGYGEGWNSKPREQLRNWLWDVSKLMRIRHDRARRAVVLVHHRQTSAEPQFAPTIAVSACDRAARLIIAGKDPWPALPDRISATAAPVIFTEVLRRIASDMVETEAIPGSVLCGGAPVNYRFIAAVF
jgi:hypothetical protein